MQCGDKHADWDGNHGKGRHPTDDPLEFGEPQFSGQFPVGCHEHDEDHYGSRGQAVYHGAPEQGLDRTDRGIVQDHAKQRDRCDGGIEATRRPKRSVKSGGLGLQLGTAYPTEPASTGIASSICGCPTNECGRLREHVPRTRLCAIRIATPWGPAWHSRWFGLPTSIPCASESY